MPSGWYDAALSKSTSFSLGEHFTRFVEARVSQGRYGSAADVVRAGLRRLEEREATLAALRAALFEGEQSGPSTSFDAEGFIARKRSAQPRKA
jgi:antitoxin ParD1/3/4